MPKARTGRRATPLLQRCWHNTQVLALLNGVPTWAASSTLSTISGTLAVANGGTGATTLTGLIKGNGTSAFTAAAAGTDYVAPGTTITAGTGLSGGGDLSTNRTLSLNLGNANTWTALQQFASGASSTLESIFNTLYVGGTATTTITSAGVNLPTGGVYQINGTNVLSGSALGVGITSSSLTSLGTLTGLTVSGNTSLTNSTTTSLFVNSPLFNSVFIGGTATSSFSASGVLTLSGGLNGPLHANNGVVGATTSISALYGGTGQTSVTTGDLLYGSATNAWSKLGIGTGGYVLGVSNGLPAWVATTTLANISGTLSGTQLDGIFGSSGILARTSTGAYASRTITGTNNQITVTNGDGISGNPTLSLPSQLSFTQSSSTRQSIIDRLYVGDTATTTIFGSATSTFGAGIAGSYLNLTGTTASSTASNGFNITAGCFAINGSCVGGSGGAVSSVSNSDGTLTISPTTGAVIASLALSHPNGWTGLQQFSNASTSLFSNYGPAYFGATATSSFATNGALTLASALTVANGGTGLTSYTSGSVLYASGATTLAGTTTANLKATLALSNVENTALSTWAGSTNLTTLGTITSGTWSGTTIAVNKGGTGVTSSTGSGSVVLSTSPTFVTDLRAPFIYDSNDTNYYVDPNGTSVLNAAYVNIIYDTADGGYYLDPASISRVNDIRPNIMYDGQDTNYYVDPNGNTRLYGAYSNIYGIVNADAAFSGGWYTYATVFSDQRLKTDVVDYAPSANLDRLMQLKPVSFHWKDKAFEEQQGETIGFIAQDVEKLYPDLVWDTGEPITITKEDGSQETIEHPKKLRYEKFVVPLVKAVQEIAAISGTFKANLIAWLGDAQNGIEKIFAKEIVATRIYAVTGTFGTLNTGSLTASSTISGHTLLGDELCARKSDGSQFCATGDQLAAILAETSAGAPSESGRAPASRPVSSAGTASTTTASNNNQPPVIEINGANPATIPVGSSYADLGATITGPEADLNLGIHLYVDGALTDSVQLDTSVAGNHTIDYVVADPFGLTATSTRTVIVSPPANDDAPAASSTPQAENDNTPTVPLAATGTEATSTP